MRQGGVLAPERTLTTALSGVEGGPDNERILWAQLRDQPLEVFGEPLHSLVMVGRRLYHPDAEYVAAFAINATSWKEVTQNVYGQLF